MRVARSRPTSRIPVAGGSRVPAWPTRFVANRRRRRLTTSCDVGPACLSTTSSPPGAGPPWGAGGGLECGPDGLDGLLAPARGGEAGGPGVAATPEGRRDLRHVDLAPRAHRHLVV